MEVNSTHHKRNEDLLIQNNGTSKAMKPSNDQNFQLNSSSGLVEAPDAVLPERLCESTQVSSSTGVDMAINDVIKNFKSRLYSSKDLSQENKIKIEKEARKKAEDEINTIILKEREKIEEDANEQISDLEEALKKVERRWSRMETLQERSLWLLELLYLWG